MNNFLKGYGDPVAARENTIRGSLKSDETHIKGFLSSGKFPKGTTFKRLPDYFWEYLCGSCNKTHKGYLSHLKEGKMSCNCNGSGGFDKSKRSSAYIVRWSDGENSYLKMGITNQQVKDRVTQQSRKTKLLPTILFTFENNDGKLVANAETHIKSYLDNGVCPKELLPDGYTETYEDTQENLDYMVNYLSQKLN